MYVDSIYSLVALLLTAAFGLIGAVQLIGPRFVRDAYKRWDYGPRARIVTGVLDVMAAIMLAIPVLRGWGIALAAILTFGSVVVFLNHRQYRYALPAIGLLIALVPATVAVPRPAQIQFIAQKSLPTSGSDSVLASDDSLISKISIEQPGAERRRTPRVLSGVFDVEDIQPGIQIALLASCLPAARSPSQSRVQMSTSRSIRSSSSRAA